MKKITLICLLILLSSASNSEEEVNLSCAFYESFEWDNLETTKTKPEDESLVIYPKTKKFTYDGVTGHYGLSGNKINFTLYQGDIVKYDYLLDRVSSVFKYDFSIKSSKTKGQYVKRLTFKGKCRKVEILF